MPRQIIDSYTGEPIGEIYVSTIAGIKEAKASLFQGKYHQGGQYEAQRIGDSERFALRRIADKKYGALPLGTVSSETDARKALSWLIVNDRRIRRALDDMPDPTSILALIRTMFRELLE